MAEQLLAVPSDRTGWGPGPWDDEPDREDWVAAGFACFVKRGPTGAWCGYVGVPHDHPWFGVGYDDVRHADGSWPEVHGGLTYAAQCRGLICHVPEPGMPDVVWWLGFDCNHADDLAPVYATRLPGMGTYRDLAYARAQTEDLAAQALAARG